MAASEENCKHVNVVKQECGSQATYWCELYSCHKTSIAKLSLEMTTILIVFELLSAGSVTHDLEENDNNITVQTLPPHCISRSHWC